jgi:two-component system sensor histidine kinase/response regulator
MNAFASGAAAGLVRSTRVLVVDDFEAMCKVTVNQLRQVGVERVVTAKNGAEALRHLQTQRFDIVLSDWNMPVMTGIELLKAMRADPQLSALPFVLITAEAERGKVEEAVTHGVTSMLLKPYTPQQLITRVEKALLWTPRKPVAQAMAEVAQAAVPAPSPPAPNKAGEAEEPAVAKDPRPTVLVVDDTPDNLVLLSSLFRDEYRVRLAQTGAKALQFVTSDSPPDLVLLDVMMPGIDGFEVARRMREHPSSQSIPIIFITTLSTADARLQGLDLGAVDFITKPVDPITLKPRVRNFMRYVQLRRDLQAEFDGMVEAAQLREDVDRITRHDLRGPLAGALGVLQALLQDEALGRRQLEQVRLAEEITLQVMGMINLSAELYRIETGRFELKATEVKLGELLRRIVETARVTYAEKALSIAVDTDMPIGAEAPRSIGDETFCFSVFQNLVKNACEAAPARSKLTISLLDQDPLKVVIENKGVVPLGIRERFFEKFVTAGKPGGSGLGTYSARMLVEAQRGEIAMQADDENGLTRITVTLPRAAT